MPGIIAAMQTMSIRAPGPVGDGLVPHHALPPAHRLHLGRDRRTAADTDVIPPLTGQFCSVPHSSPVAVRGARNLPCMEVPE